jgi:hypothetical protein
VWPQNGETGHNTGNSTSKVPATTPVEKTTKRPKGRPRKMEKRHALLVRLPADVFESLRACAFDMRTSMTELVGTAVADWLTRHRRG